MKKVLITGGSGFIGRNLTEQLSKVFSVSSPSSKELDLLDDIAVKKYLQKHAFDEVIHCATHNATKTSDKDLSSVFYNNLRMFFNLARNNTVYGRMFYFGSAAEYSKEHLVPRVTEEYFDTYVPKSPYGFSKYISAKYVLATPNIYDLRIFGCFGKYEDWRIRFISNAICKVVFNMDITIKQNVFFDYLYINDLVEIMEIILKTSVIKHKHYNICTGSTIDLFSIAKIINNISEKNVSITVAKKGLNKELSGDNKRFIEEFGSYTFTSCEQAITELYRWYESNKAIIDKNQLLIDP